jgi:hypothetical protein
VSIQNLFQITDARASIRNGDDKDLLRTIPNEKLHRSACGIAKGVARQLRCCGSETDLLLMIKTEKACDIACTLAGMHHVALVPEP